jgi:hypothetical protein
VASPCRWCARLPVQARILVPREVIVTPPCPPMFGSSTRFDRSPLITVPSQAAAVLRTYAERTKVSSSIESPDLLIMLKRLIQSQEASTYWENSEVGQ